MNYKYNVHKTNKTYFSIRHFRYFFEKILHCSDWWPEDFRQLRYSFFSWKKRNKTMLLGKQNQRINVIKESNQLYKVLFWRTSLFYTIIIKSIIRSWLECIEKDYQVTQMHMIQREDSFFWRYRSHSPITTECTTYKKIHYFSKLARETAVGNCYDMPLFSEIHVPATIYSMWAKALVLNFPKNNRP